MTIPSTHGSATHEPAPAWLNTLIDAAHRTWHGAGTSQDRARFAEFEVQRLYGGRNNPLYRFRPPGGRWCCLKLHLVDDRQRAQREWQALRLLSGRGEPAVPRPVYHRPSDSRPALVMEFLDGTPLGDRSLGPARLAALRAALQAMYTITPDKVHEPMLEVVTTAAGMVKRMRERWRVLAGKPPIDGTRASLLDAWRAWNAGPDPQFLSASAPAVFGRGDPSLGNCLWDGSRVALVDFEYAGWTDRAFELGDLVEHPQSRATPDTTWEQLIEGFGLTDQEHARYMAARRLLCFFWLARWWPATGQPDTTARFAAQAERAQQLLADVL
ncbi:MAG: phosphotransferase family protein [Egibacteraceae bacterium]